MNDNNSLEKLTCMFVIEKKKKALHTAASPHTHLKRRCRQTVKGNTEYIKVHPST